MSGSIWIGWNEAIYASTPCQPGVAVVVGVDADAMIITITARPYPILNTVARTADQNPSCFNAADGRVPALIESCLSPNSRCASKRVVLIAGPPDFLSAKTPSQ